MLLWEIASGGNFLFVSRHKLLLRAIIILKSCFSYRRSQHCVKSQGFSEEQLIEPVACVSDVIHENDNVLHLVGCKTRTRT